MTPVTVVVPLWNDASFIRECLLSINVHDDVIGEVIVVDNASSDRSADLVTAIALPKVRLIRNETNVGAARARHQAMELASFPLVTFLDSDDKLLPNAVKTAVSDLTSRSLDMSIYTMKRLALDGSIGFYIAALKQEITGNEAFSRTIGGWSIHPMGVFRKQVYDAALNGFTFRGHSDDEIIGRLMFLNADRVSGNAGVYLYRDKPRTYSMAKVIGQTRTNLRALRLAIDQGVDAERLRHARNNVVRNLLGIVRRKPASDTEREALARLTCEAMSLAMPWRLRDMPQRAALRAVHILYPVDERSNVGGMDK